MKLYFPGEKSRAICEDCGRLVTTTFGYHDVPFSDGKGLAKGILAATCDDCGAVVAVPAQSTPAIAKAREQAESPLEVVLPAPEMEVLDAAAFRIDPQATSRFRKAVFTYYIGLLDEEPGLVERLKLGLADWFERTTAIRQQARRNRISVPTRRLSMKIAPRTEARLERVMMKSGLNKTDIFRGIVMLTKHDVLDVEIIGKSRAGKDLKVLANTVNG
ncbi:hypothetical protein CCR83_08635 [Rhodobacter veldkampii DSM 11550]|uniref:Uncharacterized protein n=1 Tax=Phaeovulum veldkampii DSM 11550 TaxID=1185920 RepID=A0A2T4JFP5_9RHOB|nr:hypothetical protein [Phaeovulum veldkampii]MBK5946494.1 hypothetical protein [Phaeovulum veldkampii DSM 11550]PTE16739.1 hypothetical protein C5F46_12780 [Phaeovulum veldkampii DSM 11550]TDQ54603.1 hypothetical protein EV658_1308 [Phaeovulum veldkampii DSM 11550]